MASSYASSNERVCFRRRARRSTARSARRFGVRLLRDPTATALRYGDIVAIVALLLFILCLRRIHAPYERRHLPGHRASRSSRVPRPEARAGAPRRRARSPPGARARPRSPPALMSGEPRRQRIGVASEAVALLRRDVLGERHAAVPDGAILQVGRQDPATRATPRVVASFRVATSSPNVFAIICVLLVPLERSAPSTARVSARARGCDRARIRNRTFKPAEPRAGLSWRLASPPPAARPPRAPPCSGSRRRRRTSRTRRRPRRSRPPAPRTHARHERAFQRAGRRARGGSARPQHASAPALSFESARLDARAPRRWG